MRKLLLATTFGCLAVMATSVASANLLTNASFEDPDLAGVEDAGVVPTGWTMEEGQLFTPGGNTAQINHFGVGFDGDQAIWYRPFEGGDGTNPAFAHVRQSVPGTPGQEYAFSAWWLFESFYAGGLAAATGPQTQSIQAIDFLDASGGVISSAELDVRLDGKIADEDNNTPDEWTQHWVSGIAPAGTVAVEARLSMIDGISGPGNPQSVFVDSASLTAVPEPATVAIAAMACMGLAARRRS